MKIDKNNPALLSIAEKQKECNDRILTYFINDQDKQRYTYEQLLLVAQWRFICDIDISMSAYTLLNDYEHDKLSDQEKFLIDNHKRAINIIKNTIDERIKLSLKPTE